MSVTKHIGIIMIAYGSAGNISGISGREQIQQNNIRPMIGQLRKKTVDY